MPPSSPSSADSKTSAEGRLVWAAQAAAALARRLTTGVAALAGSSAGAGGLLWGLFWWPLPDHWGLLVVAGGALLVSLAPAAVLGLFWLGLRDLLALPGRLSERTTRTVEQSVEAAQTVTRDVPRSGLGRLWALGKKIWALRTVLLENRALLLRYGALVRFVNPGFLLLVVGAAGASFLLIPGAVGAGLLVWLL